MGGMLDGLRVLELSSPSTMLAARILGDFGADVIAVEPLGGSKGRRLDPFVDDIPGLDRSLAWQALNYNKRSISLNSQTADGRAILTELCAKYDTVIEAITPGVPSMLDGLNMPKSLIHCTIAQFSFDGPKSTYRASDLAIMAASGAPTLAGNIKRPPLFFPVPQAIMDTGSDAVLGVLGAIAARDQDGLGQKVEISARVAAMTATFARILYGQSGDVIPTRESEAPGALATRLTYDSIDGYVLVHIFLSGAFAALTKGLVKWLVDEGVLGEDMLAVDWTSFAVPEPPPLDAVRQLEAAINALTSKRSKVDIMDAAREYGFVAAPVMDMNDISQFEHHRDREMFVTTETLVGGKEIEVPARFVRMSEAPIEIRRRAPMFSEHTFEILTKELAMTANEVQALFTHGVI